MLSEGLDVDHSTVLSALYLRGCPVSAVGSSARGWRAVLRELRLAAASAGEAEQVLRKAGLWSEAARLSCPGLLSWAERLVGSGRVLTVASPLYPRRWLHVLQLSAPPAIWIAGEWPATPMVGVVGSRVPSRESRLFASQVGEAAARAKVALVSGGAAGIDRASVRGSLSADGPAVEVLPFGLSHAHGAREGVCRVSVCAPSEPFSSVGAMERNALIFAASQATLVVQPRLREGGSWHGATSALRRHLCEVRVFRQVGNPACTALEALGAVPVTTPAEAIAPPLERPSLFSPRR